MSCFYIWAMHLIFVTYLKDPKLAYFSKYGLSQQHGSNKMQVTQHAVRLYLLPILLSSDKF